MNYQLTQSEHDELWLISEQQRKSAARIQHILSIAAIVEDTTHNDVHTHIANTVWHEYNTHGNEEAHHHGINPHLLDSKLGNGIYTILGGSISAPWMTAHENHAKHDGYTWLGSAKQNGNIAAWRYQMHAMFPHGGFTRYHSGTLEARFTNGGFIRVGGHFDTGYTLINGVHFPLEGDKPLPQNVDAAWFQGQDRKLLNNRSHTWYGTMKELRHPRGDFQLNISAHVACHDTKGIVLGDGSIVTDGAEGYNSNLLQMHALIIDVATNAHYEPITAAFKIHPRTWQVLPQDTPIGSECSIVQVENLREGRYRLEVPVEFDFNKPASEAELPFEIVNEAPIEPVAPVTPAENDTRVAVSTVDRVSLSWCSRSDGWGFNQADIDAINTAGIEKIKFMTNEPISNYTTLIEETDATAELLRLYFPRNDSWRDLPEQTLVDFLMPQLRPWFTVKDDWIVEVGNENNHTPVEGFGTMWKDAAHYQRFFLAMADAIRSEFPNALIAYPGLSPSVRGTTGLYFIDFIKQTPLMVQSADVWCVHSYWQQENLISSPIFGASFIPANTALLEANNGEQKRLILSEVANTLDKTPMEQKAVEYLQHWNSLHGNDIGLTDWYGFTLHDHRPEQFKNQQLVRSFASTVIGGR